MNPTRATAFVHNSNSKLKIDPNWPVLPDHITLFCVSGIALDSRGYIYVAHRGDNPLLRFHPDGSFDREIAADVLKKSRADNLMGDKPIPMDLRNWLHYVHVDPWDNVWITDVGRHLIMRFDPAGQLTKTLGVDGVSGCDAEHFYQPTHVCVMPSGEFFVSDGYGNSRVLKFSAEGKRVMEWGSRGTAIGEFHTPHVITSDEDGKLYISDRENDRVLVYDQQGECLAEWPGLHSVDGLDYGPDGFIYAGAGLDGAILRLDKKGQLIDVWAEPGQFGYPHGIAIASDGTIYTAETDCSRVLRSTLVPSH